jgi:glucose/arabinose dehydrogenase
MKNIMSLATLALLGLSPLACDDDSSNDNNAGNPAINTPGQSLTGELPKADPSFDAKKLSQVHGWPQGLTPRAPAGFTVTEYAAGLDNPRWSYVLPNGDVLVTEANTLNSGAQEVNLDPAKAARRGTSANRVTLLRDANGDGVAEFKTTLVEGLSQPLGMTFLNNQLYIANTDSLLRFPYTLGQEKLDIALGTKILDLPKGGYNNHWTRNLLTNADGSKIYISVGSSSNIAEHGMREETRRANILEINPDGTGERIFASGLRNPVGMDWAPGTNELWAVVNERDYLGEELVPDYLTRVVDQGFYGWPYSYFGANPDPRLAGQRMDLVAQAIVPTQAVGAHTASLGMAFYKANAFPQKYRNGVFVSQHGSWNKNDIAGYKVIFYPFANGQISGPAEDFLTGFIINATNADVYGRPMGVTVGPQGELLVADDSGDKIWAVKAAP